MTITLTTSPEYPVPKQKVKLNFSSDAGANFVRLFLSDAPVGSKEYDKKKESGAKQYQFYEGPIQSQPAFEPAITGKYRFVVHEISRGSSWGGGYKEDPAAEQTETLIAQGYFSVVVGARVTLTMHAGDQRATLVLYAFDDYVRATTKALHGEVSPALINASGPIAQNVVQDGTLVGAVSALADQLASTLIGDPSGVLDNIITKYEAHRASAVFHSSADSDNTVSSDFSGATTAKSLQRSAQEVYTKLNRHMTNDDGAGTGEGSGSYHGGGIDWGAKLIADAGGSLPQTLAKIADCWRAYEAHRVNATVHASADATNTLSALPALLDVYRIFIDKIQAATPSVPQTENEAKVLLTHQFGFTVG